MARDDPRKILRGAFPVFVFVVAVFAEFPSLRHAYVLDEAADHRPVWAIRAEVPDRIVVPSSVDHSRPGRGGRTKARIAPAQYKFTSGEKVTKTEFFPASRIREAIRDIELCSLGRKREEMGLDKAGRPACGMPVHDIVHSSEWLHQETGHGEF